MKFSRIVAGALAITVLLWLPQDAQGKKKKKKGNEEPPTQVLEVPKDPPLAVTAETRRLAFHTSPLSAKGLLSQQSRDALRALLRLAGSNSIVKLRAFVAGSGDVRRVQAIVSEVFTDRHLALPVLTVVQAGALPMEGAQVVMESTEVARKEVNPNGLAFISGQQRSEAKPLQPLAPLAERSLADLEAAVRATRGRPEDVLRVTCFLTALDDLAAVRKLVEARFPAAALDYVQARRAAPVSTVACEAVARLGEPPSSAVEFLNPEGLARATGYSQVAMVNSPRLALTGLQMAFGFQDGDARLAFQRLDKALDAVKASAKRTVMADVYPLHPDIAAQVRKIRMEFFDPANPPASTVLPFEGLPSMDAGFGVDVVAALDN